MQSRHFVFAAALLMQLLPHARAYATEQEKKASHFNDQADASITSNLLTLNQAILLALKSNPELRSAQQSVDIANGVREQATAFPNPEFSVLKEGLQKSTSTQTIQLSQTLELGGKRQARINVAEHERQLATNHVTINRAELRAEVVAAYLEALNAIERANLVSASLELAQKASNAAAKRLLAGKISPLEQKRSDIAEANVRLELAQANVELKQARRRLAGLLGRSDDLTETLVMPEFDLAEIPSLNELKARLDTSPQLRQARMQIAREEAQLKLEHAQQIPDVTVVIGNKKDYETGRSQNVVGISVPLPLFNRNQGNLLSALNRVEKAKTAVEIDYLRMSQQLADAYERAQVSQHQISTIRHNILPAAQAAFDAAVTGFEMGKFNFLDVLDAQRTLFQSRTQYLRAVSDRYRSIGEIQRYVSVDGIESGENFFLNERNKK
ncbi:TolC family protein [Undibacterium sp. Dicai25W]|uniref:TolC family protein n=1 Tax=Undibacterium sp. Dicai25W TaxID=3413034 RepID=UPI003BF1D2F7